MIDKGSSQLCWSCVPLQLWREGYGQAAGGGDRGVGGVHEGLPEMTCALHCAQEEATEAFVQGHGRGCQGGQAGQLKPWQPVQARPLLH